MYWSLTVDPPLPPASPKVTSLTPFYGFTQDLNEYWGQ